MGDEDLEFSHLPGAEDASNQRIPIGCVVEHSDDTVTITVRMKRFYADPLLL